jgi:hypothetical protein
MVRKFLANFGVAQHTVTQESSFIPQFSLASKTIYQASESLGYFKAMASVTIPGIVLGTLLVPKIIPFYSILFLAWYFAFNVS